MHLGEGKSPEHVSITFDNLDERYQFGASTPAFVSKEYYRFLNYMARDMYGTSYDKMPFPQTIEARKITVGIVLARLNQKMEAPNQEVADVATAMAETISAYLGAPPQSRSSLEEIA
jgi:hypothetical protein